MQDAKKLAKFVSVIRETLILLLSDALEDAGTTEGLKVLLQVENWPIRSLDLRGMEGTSCYCDPAAAEEIRAALAPYPAEGVHWIDSGDYHYLSTFFAERIRRPYTLLLLDHHTDRQETAFPGLLSCGSWVAALQEADSYLQGVVSVGPQQEVEFLGSPDLKGPLYVSLDKDILSEEWARTGWSQGEWSLPELLPVLKSYFDAASEIIGIDICGALPIAKGARPEDLSINRRTDIEIQRFIMNYFKQL